jgi:hypothetical protein
MYSAPYFPIGISLLISAGLLGCSALGIQKGLGLWSLAVAIPSSVFLSLTLEWAIVTSNEVQVPTWIQTLAVVRTSLVISLLLLAIWLTPFGRRSSAAALSTLLAGASAALAVVIISPTLGSIQIFLWPVSVAACLCLVGAALFIAKAGLTRIG